MLVKWSLDSNFQIYFLSLKISSVCSRLYPFSQNKGIKWDVKWRLDSKTYTAHFIYTATWTIIHSALYGVTSSYIVVQWNEAMTDMGNVLDCDVTKNIPIYFITFASLSWTLLSHSSYRVKWYHVINFFIFVWKWFHHHWPFVRRIHRSSMNSPHKGPVMRNYNVCFVVSLV